MGNAVVEPLSFTNRIYSFSVTNGPVIRHTSIMLLVLLLFSGSSQVLADDYNCTGTVGAITVDNLNVPQNETCTLNGTRVEGNIFVRNGATQYANNVRVDGNIQADQAARVEVRPGSFVGGSIQVDDSGPLVVSRVHIMATCRPSTILAASCIPGTLLAGIYNPSTIAMG
jgi:hypothetical protein